MGAARAYDYAYEYDYGYAPPARPVAERPPTPVKRQAAPMYVLTGEKVKKLPVTYAITMAIIFAGMFCMLTALAEAQKSKNVAIRINNEIKEQAALVSTLSEELKETFNLTDVRETAVNGLGMRERQPYQIIRINIPKQSYAVSNHTVEEEPAVSYEISSIKNFFRR